MKVLITTVPFGQKDTQPLEKLNNAGIEYLINPINRKLDEDEIASIIGEYDWKYMLDNPENLQIDLEMIPETLKSVTKRKSTFYKFQCLVKKFYNQSIRTYG